MTPTENSLRKLDQNSIFALADASLGKIVKCYENQKVRYIYNSIEVAKVINLLANEIFAGWTESDSAEMTTVNN